MGDPAPLPIETRCLHTGSSPTVLAPGRASGVDLMERERERGRVTISYDSNLRPGLLGEATRAKLDIERLGGARRDALAAIDEATLGSVVDAAALIAAITSSRPGADPPKRAEVDAALAAG